MRQKLNHTKIIATVGPSSDNKAVIKELMLAGVNVFRLNFSHGTHKEHENSIKLIREVSNETGLNIAIMADLQGPKIELENKRQCYLKRRQNSTDKHKKQ